MIVLLGLVFFCVKILEVDEFLRYCINKGLVFLLLGRKNMFFEKVFDWFICFSLDVKIVFFY